MTYGRMNTFDIWVITNDNSFFFYPFLLQLTAISSNRSLKWFRMEKRSKQWEKDRKIEIREKKAKEREVKKAKESKIKDAEDSYMK